MDVSNIPVDQEVAASVAPNSYLRTHGLNLSYGPVRAVNDLNLNVNEGQVYGFLGRNGAGKTSTIRMLMGVIRPDSGEIELGDFRGRRIGVRQKRGIGYVSQEQHFYPWMTCFGLGRFVSGFYPGWDREEFRRLLQLLDLPPNRRVAHLSGGMRVKLALAIALAHRPAILILDEPTSGLDPVARREFLNIIQQQSRDHGRTTFFSSHLIDEVEQAADRIGIIKRGTLCYEGDIAGLRESVRRVPITADQPLEHIVDAAVAAGLEVLEAGAITDTQSVAMRGTPEQWATSAFTGEQLQQLPLEDLFISLVGEPTPNL